MHCQPPKHPKLQDSKADPPRMESARTAISRCFHTAWTRSGSSTSPRLVKKPVIWPGASLDHLIGAGEERLRDRQAERVGRLEVDHQLKFARLYHWQIG